MIHTTIGLYPDLSYKVNGVLPEDLQAHIEYNKTHRFGRALFVDGVCVYKGTVRQANIDSFAEKIKTENIKVDKCTRPYQ